MLSSVALATAAGFCGPAASPAQARMQPHTQPKQHASAPPQCATSNVPLQQVLCESSKLGAANDSLALAYEADLQRLTSEGVSELRVDQLQWLTWVQLVCNVGDPGVTNAEAAQCLEAPFRDRTQALRTSLSVRNGVLFLTRTAYLAVPATPEDGSSEDVTRVRFAGYDTLIASWPEAQAKTNAWAAWNRAMLENTQAITHATGKRPDSTDVSGSWKDEAAAGNDSDATTRILDIDGDRVTTHTEIVMWRGAHPAESYGNTTWLLEDGRPLVAADVFRHGADWQTAIAEACWKQLQVSPGTKSLYPQVTGPTAEVLRKLVTDTANWRLAPDGLHIDYPEYTVAPLIAQPNDGVISWSALKPLLAPGFVPPAQGN